MIKDGTFHPPACSALALALCFRSVASKHNVSGVLEAATQFTDMGSSWQLMQGQDAVAGLHPQQTVAVESR